MARNVRIKSRIASVEGLVPKAAAIADKGPVEIIQDDTFFRCESGRLKLRAFPREVDEIICRFISTGYNKLSTSLLLFFMMPADRLIANIMAIN